MAENRMMRFFSDDAPNFKIVKKVEGPNLLGSRASPLASEKKGKVHNTTWVSFLSRLQPRTAVDARYLARKHGITVRIARKITEAMRAETHGPRTHSGHRVVYMATKFGLDFDQTRAIVNELSEERARMPSSARRQK